MNYLAIGKEICSIFSLKSFLTSKGQVTLPKPLRDRLGLKAGDVLEFDENLPYIKAVRRFDADRMRSVIGRGSAKAGQTIKSILDSMRGKVDLS